MSSMLTHSLLKGFRYWAAEEKLLSGPVWAVKVCLKVWETPLAVSTRAERDSLIRHEPALADILPQPWGGTNSQQVSCRLPWKGIIPTASGHRHGNTSADHLHSRKSSRCAQDSSVTLWLPPGQAYLDPQHFEDVTLAQRTRPMLQKPGVNAGLVEDMAGGRREPRLGFIPATLLMGQLCDTKNLFLLQWMTLFCHKFQLKVMESWCFNL